MTNEDKAVYRQHRSDMWLPSGGGGGAWGVGGGAWTARICTLLRASMQTFEVNFFEDKVFSLPYEIWYVHCA